MNVYAITEKRVRIQRERLIVQAQELAAANGDSPLQPMDTLSLLAQRTAQTKQPRGGENLYQQNRSQESVFPRLTTFGNTNITITPSRMTSAQMPHPRDLISKLGDRDITMMPAHNGSLSIMPIKRDSFPFKNSTPNGKSSRDTSMVSASKEEGSGEEPTDLSMPTDLSVHKRPTPKDLSKLNIPPATTISVLSTTPSNQPVDLSVKSSRPKTQEDMEYKYEKLRYEKYPIAKKYKPDKLKKQEYESEAEMDGDEMDDMDMEPGTEAGMDGDMTMEEAYEPETESELDSRPGATPDSLSSHSMHADDRHEGYGARPDAPLPFFFQPNINDIAMVNSFFLNQLWQPEFIDTELLKEYHRKREELKEKKKQQRKMSKPKPTPEAESANEDAEAEKESNAEKDVNQTAAEEEEESEKKVEESEKCEEEEKEKENEDQEMVTEEDEVQADAEVDEEEKPSSDTVEKPDIPSEDA